MNAAPKRIAAALGLVCSLVTAQAGQNCEAGALKPAQVVQGLELAQAMQQALQASGAEVALIARAAQDLSHYGLRWSHLGFAYREAAAEPGQPPRWRVLHKLNPCGTARGELYRQGLGEFFLDQPQRHEAVMQPLAPWLQQQLLPLLRDDRAAARLHTPRYSMVTVESVQRFVSLQGLGQTPTLVQRPAVRVPADPAPVPATVPAPVPATARSPA